MMMMMMLVEEEEVIVLNATWVLIVLSALPIELWEASILPSNLAINKTQLNIVP